ncbi:transmembrane protease serine 9-like [Anopheles moucheti]|uniref:transmembrane protease serine 9-like n=1 Tax=Anopheles moucheti TaxID=186751 RepID=UPI0022F11DA7|nr:transmembrane protease serine 9-like [Anopheles moucheti]
MRVPRSVGSWSILPSLLVLGICLGPVLGSSSCSRVYDSNVQCGLPVLHPSGLPKHSSEALRGEFPWHVAIFQIEYRIPVYSCGGSLVSNRYLLTAAHCVVNPNNGYTLSPDNFLLQMGYHELGLAVEGCSQQMGVKRVYVHPEFRTGTYRHDLAIIELERPVQFNDRVLPVCLDTEEEDPSSFYRQMGKVPGWGYTEFDEVSTELRMTEVPTVNYTRCLASNTQVFSNTIYDGMFCAGYANGTNVCNGDSGGGFVTYRNARWELQGIVSFTALRDTEMTVCDTQQYAAFVKLRYYRGWIGSVLDGTWQWSKSEKLVQLDDEQPAEMPTDCGKRKINKMPLIVNGVRSMAGEWPWHAAIFVVSKRSRDYLCGGTLISRRYILTAASCVTDWHYRKRPYIVQLGQHQLWESSLTGREVRVLDIETSDDSMMALLKLEVDVQYDDYIQPICLPAEQQNTTNEALRIGTNGLIVGYGQTDPDGNPSELLQATLMPIVDSGLCAIYRIFDKREAHKMFCAGHGNGTNACRGDQGGGFYEESQQSIWTLTGVIGKINLYRKRCDPYGYVGMANVLHYLEWILGRLRSALAGPSDTFEVVPPTPKGHSKGCRRKHHHHHHHHHHGSQEHGTVTSRPHRQKGGSGESGSSENSNESREPSITSAVKNVMQAKVDLVKDIHGVASSKIKKIFG